MTVFSNLKPKRKFSRLFTKIINSFAKEASKLRRIRLFFPNKVKFHGHFISEQAIQPVAKRVIDLQNLKPAKRKRDVLNFLGCQGFYSCYVKNLHVKSQPFYELIKGTIPFKWNNQDEELFGEVRTRNSEDTITAVPSIEYPFHIHVDSSKVGTGCILVQ